MTAKFMPLSLLSILVFIKADSQDLIITKNNDTIVSKVLEISETIVRYKKYTNIDGPTYVKNKMEILSITYQNGDIDTFSNKKSENIGEPLSQIDNSLLLESLTKKANKVFVDGQDKNGTIHAKRYLQNWGYWFVTDKREEADFVLFFNVRIAGLADGFASAQFIEPRNNKILLVTKEVNTITSWSINTKKGAIEKLIKKEIKPLFKNK